MEIRKKIPFAIATRKIKYLGINLTKVVEDVWDCEDGSEIGGSGVHFPLRTGERPR